MTTDYTARSRASRAEDASTRNRYELDRLKSEFAKIKSDQSKIIENQQRMTEALERLAAAVEAMNNELFPKTETTKPQLTAPGTPATKPAPKPVPETYDPFAGG